MKPYVVIKCPTNLNDITPPRGSRNLVWGFGSEDTKDSFYNLDGRHNYYFVETDGDADILASALATKTPGTTWLVAKTTAHFSAPPGAVKKSVVTDSGVLPF